MSDQTSTKPGTVVRPSLLRRIGRKVLALVISVAVSLVLAEFVVRLLAPQCMTVPVFDYVDGIPTNRANVSGSGSVPGLFRVTYHSNSQRFRGTREYSAQPAAGVMRIAVLGDSLCWGIGAEDDQTFPANLEQALVAAVKNVEVINAGVSGTGTGAQAMWYERGVQPLGPNLVALCVFANDVEDDRQFAGFRVDGAGNAMPVSAEDLRKASEATVAARQRTRAVPGYEFLAQHSHLVNMIRAIGTRAMNKPAAPEPRDQKEARYRAKGLVVTAGEVGYLKRSVESKGAKLVVVFLPPRGAIYPDTDPFEQELAFQGDLIRQGLADICAKQGLPFFDLTEPMRGAAKSGGVELYYKKLDDHPRPEGYRILGQALAKSLLEKDLVERR